MLILTPNQDVVFHGREDSPSDGPVVRETWVENVYRIHAQDFTDTGIAVDVGANIGAVSVFCAQWAKVVAVEPDPANLELLYRNIEQNRASVQVVEAAITPERGTVCITPAHGDTKVTETGVEVTSMPLEDVLADLPAVEVLKVDVEGSEYGLFASTPAVVLRKCRYITLEFDKTTNPAFGALVAKLAHWYGIEILGSPARGGYIYARRYD